MLRLRSALFLLPALTLVGCEGDPQPLGWELEFEGRTLLERARVVEATILEGGCSGEELYSVEVVMGELSNAEVPVLADGTWGFAGRARDESCVLFAEGCTEVELPTVGPVVVILTPRGAEIPACSSTFCEGGRCSDVPVDGGMEDTCQASETVCDDGIDDDCNGDTDCDDAACESDPGCAACAMITCDACEDCRGGECVPAADETACAGGTCWGGSCCVGCWDGISCRNGDEDTICGNGGGRCASCEGCGTCMGNACVESMPDSTPCAGGGGLCLGGVCCTGCATGSTCVPGDTPAACGLGGAACSDCGECGECTAGACGPADGTACSTGTCRAGACCDGCWDGMACQSGDQATACGAGGDMCSACLPCQRCESGVCVTGMEGDMCTSASMLPGRCSGPSLICCAGCWDGSNCQPGDTQTVCGTRGNACQNCGTFSCVGGFCR
jgi:hypothetical protein